jgi:DNA polymerase
MSAPFKQIVCIDFETYWDSKDFTLSKMTTEEYIRDQRFKAFGACLHDYGTDKTIQWYRADELARILSTYDWSVTAVLAHNAQFDVSILEWVYGVHPCFILDSLSMARALRGVAVGNRLEILAEAFDLPPKGKAVYSTNGIRELSREMEKELADYCKHDVYLCEEIFKRLVHNYPAKELRLIDMTLKMYTRPVLQLDQAMLTNALHEEKEKRESLLEKLGIEEADLASKPKFAAVLETLGVPAPTKVSKTTGKQTLALAKNDALFQALLNGEREDVASLCEARLRVKSTTERTRAQRFLDISRRGALPVPLSYYGAATGRWTASKGSAINMQNLKRGSFLRKAIMAPAGHQLVVGDLSQIEPRVLAWLADYEDMLEIFRAGGDPYAAFGAQMFNIPGLTKESHGDLRQSAKSALLGAGYGLGWASFAAQLLVGFLGAPPVRYDKEFA